MTIRPVGAELLRAERQTDTDRTDTSDEARAVESVHKSSDPDSSIFKTSDSDSFIKAQYVLIMVNL
jgi:hypothetical protein